MPKGGGRGRGKADDDYRPCASCKYQRRHCEPHCRQAQYFPLDRFPEYAVAHKMYGLSNINKIMNAVEPDQRMEAADSIMSEGKLWLLDPERGPLGVMRKLKEDIDLAEKELAAVNQQIEHHRKHGNHKDLHLTELTLKVPQASLDKGKDVQPSDVDQMVDLEGNPSSANASTSKLGESSSGKKPMELDLNEPHDLLGSSSDMNEP